jgi:ribosomal protein L7/L12
MNSLRYKYFSTKQKRVCISVVKSLKGLTVKEAKQVLLEALDKILDNSTLV